MPARAAWIIHTATLGVPLALASCAGAAAPTPAEEPQPAASPPSAAPPSQPEPEATTPADAEDLATDSSSAESAAPAPTADEEAGTASAAAKSESPPSPEPTTMPTRSPSEVLTGSNVAFMFDYNASDLKEAISTKCAAKTDEDPQKLAECMQKERGKFRADVLSFRRSPTGQLRWVVYQRERSTLAEVHDCQFKFADETAHSITIVPTGRGKGTRPLFKGTRRIFIQVPNSYSIVLNDPQYGRLVYDAKVGLMGQR